MPRKLTKKRKPVRASSVQYPERLCVGEDAQEDVTAAHGKPAQYMNQSVFSLIAAAGSKVDFNARFDEESSESEDETLVLRPDQHADLFKTNTAPSRKAGDFENQSLKKAEGEYRQNKSSDRQISGGLPQFSLKTSQERNYMSQSIILPSPKDSFSGGSSPKGLTPRDAPVMSKMLEAQAQLSPPVQLSEGQQQDIIDETTSEMTTGTKALALRLKEIFGFDNAEDVISGARSLANRCRIILIQQQNILAG